MSEPDAGVGPGADPAAGMRFPHVARLELDELLEQLIARAGDVQRTQGRLRGLLGAYLEVARADDLEELLLHILNAARDLVDATFAALGIIEDGRLVRFLHVGMDDATVAGIGHLPEGKGVLGRLVEFPEPLRLANIASHVSSVGFPEHHPPMRSFLGVPIRLGSRVFGNLYLTDKRGADEFTADDQELAQALAGAAGVAIENATLVAQARRRQRWQAAMVELTTRLLAGQRPGQALEDIVEHAMATSDADGAALCLPDADPDVLRVAVGRGTFAPLQGQLRPSAGSAVSAAIDAGGAILIEDLATDPRTAGTAGQAPAMVGALVAAPIPSAGETIGVLIVAHMPGHGHFDQADLEMIDSYARQAGLAGQLATVRRDNERLRMIDDRQQIAEDLRHGVIQRLFGLGLSLQALAPRAANADVCAALNDKVNEVDEIIRDVRSAVFAVSDDD